MTMKISDLLDKPVLSVSGLARKHHVTVEQVQAALKKGMQVEQEHTSDPAVARQIALAHLGERVDYYDQLSKFDETTRTTKAGAPGTLKAKISRLYGGGVTCAKAQKLKTRPSATAHDKAQANWFQNMNCGGATKVSEVLAPTPKQTPWTRRGSGEHEFWDTNFRFDDKRVVVEISPDVRQVGARYVFDNMDIDVFDHVDIDMLEHMQGYVVIFRVNRSTDITGELGVRAPALLSQVLGVLQSFLQQHDWDYVLFTGEPGSRDKLYAAMSDRLARKLGARWAQYRSDFVIYKPIMQEDAAGVGLVVPRVNMPAGQHADEIRRQARKFGFKVTDQGVPPQVRTDGKY